MASMQGKCSQAPKVTPCCERGGASRGSSTASVRATLLQRGGASRGSATASARATLLQRGGASRGSSTESAKVAGLEGGEVERQKCVQISCSNLEQACSKCFRHLQEMHVHAARLQCCVVCYLRSTGVPRKRSTNSPVNIEDAPRAHASLAGV